MRTIKPKARCRVCGWRGTMNVDETMRKHPERDKFGAILNEQCAGSHRLPHGIEEHPTERAARV